MPRKIKYIIFIFLLLTLSCSRLTDGSRFGKIEPLSGLMIERLDNNRFPLESHDITIESGVTTARYTFLSLDCLCNSSALLVCRDAALWTVTVNGKEMMPSKSLHILDDGDGCYVISGLVEDGENVIELRGSGKVSPIFITGEFDLSPVDDGGWCVVPAKAPELGILASQGMSFYSGEVSYRQEYEVPEKIGKRILRIPDWKGTSGVVWVNGEKVAELAKKSFKKDIGPFLKPGLNEVDVCITGVDGDFGLLKDFTLE